MAFNDDETHPEEHSGMESREENATGGAAQPGDGTDRGVRSEPPTDGDAAPDRPNGEDDAADASPSTGEEPIVEGESDEDERDYFVTLPVGPDVGLTEVVAAAQEVDRAQAAWHPGVGHSQVADVLGATAPGASLAAVIEQATERDSSDRDQATRIELIAACDRMMAHLSAVQARFAGEFLDERGGSSHSLTATHDEISCRLATTSYAAGSIISRALALEESPRLREALHGGEVSARKIDVITAATYGLDRRERANIEDYGIELAPTHTPPQLKKALAAAVIATDPSKAKERHEKEVKERCVTFEPAPHGMSWLGVYLPAEDGLSIYTFLDAIAADHAADDERCINARRADALTGIVTSMLADGKLLDGSSLPRHHGQLPHLHLSITAPVLAGDEHTPALLHGYGPIDAGHARTLAERAGRAPAPSDDTAARSGTTTQRSEPRSTGAGSTSAAHRAHRSDTALPPGTTERSTGRSSHRRSEKLIDPPRESADHPGSDRPNLQHTVPGPCPVAPGVMVGLGAHPGATWSERCDLIDRLGPDATTEELDAILGPARRSADHRSQIDDAEIWRQVLDDRGSPPRSPGSPEEPGGRDCPSDPDDPDPEWTWMCRYVPWLDPMWGLIPPPRAPHLPDGTSAAALIRWLQTHPTSSGDRAAAGLQTGSANSPVHRTTRAGPCAQIENELGLICTDAYAPSRRLRTRILDRDQTCRFPTCQVPAWRCQLDHIVPFDESLPAWAQTVETNLHALCAHHHQVKTAGLFSVERDPRTGITTWHAPTGHVYARAPEHADYTAIAHHLRDDYAMTTCEEDPVGSVEGLVPLTVPAGAPPDPASDQAAAQNTDADADADAADSAWHLGWDGEPPF